MAVDRLLGVLWLTIISSVGVVARPCAPDGIYNQENCIPMNPEREVQIQGIVSKISNYADKLAMEHDEYFDIRLMKFAIEKHSPNEPEDKNVEIQVTVNDCAGVGTSNANAGDGSSNTNVEVNKVQSDPHTDTSNTDLALSGTEVQNSAKPELIHLNLNAGDGSSNTNVEVNKVQSDPHTDTSITDLVALSGTEVQNSAKPELIHLNLNEDGQQLLQRIEDIRGHKSPFIVLLLGDEYVFI